MVRKARPVKVAIVAPTAPIAGRPKPPGTSTRSTPRFKILATHISSIGGVMRPSPSSHEAAADDMAKAGIDSARITSGPLAPAARFPFSPSEASSGGPPIASTIAAAMPTQKA